jgi:hypothetical protein
MLQTANMPSRIIVSDTRLWIVLILCRLADVNVRPSGKITWSVLLSSPYFLAAKQISDRFSNWTVNASVIQNKQNNFRHRTENRESDMTNKLIQLDNVEVDKFHTVITSSSITQVLRGERSALGVAGNKENHRWKLACCNQTNNQGGN